ncbi:MAG: 2Fe-2S iron-sulfur cluster-binding protein [Candidatus Limivicinus sp.]|jgi:ferredoxin-NADP reductase
MKYNYDKKVLKGLGVGPFLNQVKLRTAKIEEAPDSIPSSEYNVNRLAKSLHPAVQHCIITSAADHGDAKSFVLSPDRGKGTEKMAYFRAGQYVSVDLNIEGAVLSKPYTIRSAPREALGGNSRYILTVKLTDPAYASRYILANWKEGDRVDISGPLGNFYYQELRDAETVLAVAGGSGITPFFSMASAIADGTEDFNLTILYGSRTAEGILLKDELEAVAERSGGRVKIVHVLSDEEREGYEHGFISGEIIKKYAPEGDYSVFMCGPKAMYEYCTDECRKLGLKERRVRREPSGDYMGAENNEDFPKNLKGREFKLTVDIHGEKQTITCKSSESLLWAMERAGIAAPSHCRSGECGWCRSRLVSGQYYLPKEADGRRMADEKFGWIHPCCSYPLSDMEICVFPLSTK